MYQSSRSNQNYKTIASRSYGEHNLRPWHDSAMQPDVGLGAQARSTMPNLRAVKKGFEFFMTEPDNVDTAD